MDTVIHQLAVLAATTCLGVAAFSLVFPTSNVSHDLGRLNQSAPVSMQIRQNK
jgi:hypothetical protein